MDRLTAVLQQRLPIFYAPVPSRAFVAFAVALSSFMGVYIAQFGFGIQPCELCYWQRWPYYLGVPLLALILILWKRLPPAVQLGLTAIAAMIFLVSIGLATYHAGIEYKLWPGPSSCTGLEISLDFSDLSNISAEDKVIPCDVVPFSIFGISLAGFNALGSLFITVMLVWSIIGQGRRMANKD